MVPKSKRIPPSRLAVTRLGVALATLLLLNRGAALALNPIHESTYLAYASGLSQGEPALHLAAIVPSGGDALEVPAALSLALGKRVEIGAGVKTAWGNGGDAVTAWVLGGQAALNARTALGLHLLFAAEGGRLEGLTFTSHQRQGYTRRITGEGDVRLGFLDALAPGAFMAMEGGYAFKLWVTGPVSLYGGLVASSQTQAFKEHFALDGEGGVHVGTDRNSALQALVTVGLAGEKLESLRVKFGWIQGW